MRSIIFTLVLAGAAASGAIAAPWTGASPPGVNCPGNPTAHLARPGKDAEFRRLADLPPAEAYLAVLHRGPDGCIIPVKVSDRYGTLRRQSPARPPRR